MTDNHLVECTTLYGNKIMLPVSRLVLRPSAYGVILRAGRVVLVTNRRSGRYYFPGGGVEPGEDIEAALQRELLEEAGVEITAARLLHTDEDFFYYDPTDTAYHGLLHYYACDPSSLELTAARLPDDDEGDPQWVPLESLTAASFHTHGEGLMHVLRLAQAEQGTGQ